MEVYRVESENGRGVYNADFESEEAEKIQSQLFSAHSWSNLNRPATHEDFTRDEIASIGGYDNIRHGCPSVETLREWFDGFLPKFIKCSEIRIVRYKAEKVILGQSQLQCIFEPTGEEGEVIKGEELDKFIR